MVDVEDRAKKTKDPTTAVPVIMRMIVVLIGVRMLVFAVMVMGMLVVQGSIVVNVLAVGRSLFHVALLMPPTVILQQR
jgi:hypothetical protein